MEWIDINERKPVETLVGLCPGTVVLCRGKSGEHFTAAFHDGYFATVDGYDCEDVTHWMPLPEAPSGN